MTTAAKPTAVPKTKLTSLDGSNSAPGWRHARSIISPPEPEGNPT